MFVAPCRKFGVSDYEREIGVPGQAHDEPQLHDPTMLAPEEGQGKGGGSVGIGFEVEAMGSRVACVALLALLSD